jgi:hypothetical protein
MRLVMVFFSPFSLSFFQFLPEIFSTSKSDTTAPKSTRESFGAERGVIVMVDIVLKIANESRWRLLIIENIEGVLLILIEPCACFWIVLMLID